MNLDPIVALAMSIHASPGVFALLVGSGISRSAQVPTGWGVVEDLIRRVAALKDGETPADPFAWYRDKHQGEPDYSTLLEKLAVTAADRRNLLERYFERSDEETDPDAKRPTRAHQAIAQLVSTGFVRVILTTNFDRLLEAAIREAGVEPVVISTSPAAEGATPLVHTRCTIVKLHGDYLEPDIKNTVGELDSYSPAIDKLLDRVFDEYGLIVCGWSGEWDQALRNAILRAPGRRYGTYWSRIEALGARAAQLVSHRQAVDISIQDADEFFEDLASKVAALEGLNRRPLSAELAIAEAKRFLPDPIHRIRIHDLVMREVKRALATAGTNGRGQPTAESLLAQMQVHEESCSLLVPILATTAIFAERPEHDSLLVDAFRRLATLRRQHSVFKRWSDLQLYPALLALYSLGIGAVAAGRLSPLAYSLSIEVPQPNGPESAPAAIGSWILEREACKLRVGAEKLKTPVSDYLHDLLKDPLQPVFSSVDEYSDAFDCLEYILGVAAMSAQKWSPIGRFGWRRSGDYSRAAKPENRFDDFADQLLAGGMFEGKRELLNESKKAYQEMVSKARRAGRYT